MENYNLENFDKVWSRVSDTATDSEFSESSAAKLRLFIDREASDIANYSALASQCRGPVLRTVSEIISDERTHLKKLQTMHFLLTGDTYAPEVSKKEYRSVLDAFRDRYKGEISGCYEYKKAFTETENERLSELYADFSADEKRHSSILENLISNMMG